MSSTCAKKLIFLYLEVLIPAAYPLGPSTGFELSEILPKTGLVIILTSQSTNVTKSLNPGSGLKLHDIICS